MRTNKTDYIYSGKDFLKTILLILTFELFVIFVIARVCAFSEIAINNSFSSEVKFFLFPIIAGAGIIILLVPQSILLTILYFIKMRGSYLIINKEEINLGKRRIGPVNSQDKTVLSISRTSTYNNTELVIPWKNIEKIKFHKISKGIFGFVPDYYYFVIMCKNNTSYLKPINRHIIAKIQKKMGELNENFLIN